MLILFLMLCSTAIHAAISFDSQSSSLKVSSGASFVINQPISNFSGTLDKATSASISGQTIAFQDGVFKNDNQVFLSGTYNPNANTISLAGDQTYSAQRGVFLEQILVSGTNNRIEGVPVLVDAIELQDVATTVTLSIDGTLNQDIVLNSGSVRLENDLTFDDNVAFTGSGDVELNGYAVRVGGQDFTWGATIDWTDAGEITFNSDVNFTGSFTASSENLIINGNGNIMDLSGGGDLSILGTATLSFTDVVLKGVTASSLQVASGATIRMSNVTFMAAEDLSYTQGTFYIDGPTTFVQYGKDINFGGTSLLVVDAITLWRDQAGASILGTISFDTMMNLLLINEGVIAAEVARVRALF